jgi:hypothetical protein
MKMRTSGKYLSLLILLLAAQLGAQDPNLIAYYPFSGDAGDSSGNGNHGTVDGATLTSDRFGNPNQAFLFDGVNDYISATLDATEEFSVACWTKSNTTDYPGTANGTAIHMENGNQAVFLLQVDATNDKMRGRTYHGDYTIYDEAQIDLEWHFWVIKKDESHFFLYKDNSVVDSIAISLSQTANDLDFFVGQHEGGLRYWSGIIDDIRIYDRALAPGEIDSLYHIGGWDSGPSPDAYTFFDDFSDGERSSNPTWSDFVNIPPAIFEVVQDPLDATNQVLRGVGPTFATHGEIHASWDPAAARNLNSDSTMWRYRFMIPSPYGQGFSIAMRILYNDDDFIGFYVIDKTNGNQMHSSVFINGATQGETIYESDISYPLDEWLTFELTHAAASKQMQYRLTKDSDGSTIYAGIADFSAIDLLDIGDFNTLGIAAEVVRDHYIDDVEVSDWHDDRPPGLVAYYPFSGDAGDSSGNGNHGTVDGATPTTDRFGNANSAYLFFGKTDHVATNISTDDYNDVFSISVWMKSSDYHNAGQEIYLANNYDGAGKGWNLYFDNDESDYLYFLGDDQASDPKIHLDQFTSNTWYHVVAWRKTACTVSLSTGNWWMRRQIPGWRKTACTVSLSTGNWWMRRQIPGTAGKDAYHRQSSG